ncbi:MAG TPA: diacylglycerol kinase family protein [Blastocatellia bacterium]|nr:diacylglycerol kinase family protein [Blastocatellia bacterium]
MAGARAAIIYNPNSGRASDRAETVQSMLRLLAARGMQASALATSQPNEGHRLASEAIAAGADIIVAHGGDGTVNEIIQGMIGTDARLAVWAGGTANVAANDLGMPSRMERVADVITAGKEKRISLGIATGPGCERLPAATGNKPYQPGRYFFMFAGIGLDASICRTVDLELKRKTGQFAYLVSGIKHLFSWHPEPFTLEIDGKRYESAFALVGNGSKYGGGINMTPNARLESPWFDVYILPPDGHNLTFVFDLAGCLLGQPNRTRGTTVTGQMVKAESGGEPWVEVDGEVLGPLPMGFEVVPKALSVIVP